MSGGRVTVVGVSIVLVVGVVIALIAGLNHNSNGGNSASSEKDELSTSSKAVAAICRPTDYKQACIDSLGGLAKNDTASPKDLIKAAINSTIRHVEAAMHKSAYLGNSSSTNPS
ncbi:Putative pectinesterase/pectinesterase inhibitor 28 [Morus notabilis]|uniref:Putative pectinesterase/pectinesterase inhibitor 28 n=1 Tax=Morus notabilis TaxID=981085 RepID=W9RG88_9ROSA|nr:Putative pectinesterase/pectinesterase inhibitor 28 [Morus notabilis]